MTARNQAQFKRWAVGVLIAAATGVLGWTANKVLDIPIIQQDLAWIKQSLTRIENRLDRRE